MSSKLVENLDEEHWNISNNFLLYHTWDPATFARCGYCRPRKAFSDLDEKNNFCRPCDNSRRLDICHTEVQTFESKLPVAKLLKLGNEVSTL